MLRNRWEYVYVMAYSLSSNQHIVKQFQNIRSIRLGEYRIRCPADMNNAEAHIEHTPVNSSVLEEKNGIRSYRIDLVDHHALPQVVGVVFSFPSSFPFEITISPRKDSLRTSFTAGRNDGGL